MSTKTYNYLFNGNPGSVDVTVNVLACNTIANPEGAEGDLIGFQEIEVTLSDSLPFALLLNFTVDYNLITGFGSSSSTYPIILTVPAGLTAHTIEDIQCFERTLDPFSESTWEYTFEEQSETQEVGGPLSASVTSVSDATCFGIPNGSILINASGGSGGYVYIWSDGGPNSPLRSAILAGTYSVIVRDSALNEVVLSGIIVAQPTQIQANPTITPVTCFGGNNGAISVSASGSTGPYSYSWSDGSTQQNRSNLFAGTYVLTVIAANGCNQAFTIVVPQPPQLTITVNRSGKNVTNVISGGVAPYTYLWSDGIITKDRTNMENGVYSFTVTDANGCQQSTVIVIQDFKFYFSKNPIWLSLQADDLGTKDNLSFVCEVFLEEDYLSGDFEKKYESEQPAKINGSTDFNVEQVLNSFLDSIVPSFGDAQIRQVSEAFKRFYLQYFEKFGTPPVPSATTQVDTFYVLFGGLSEQEFARQVFFDTYLDSQKPFLTWQPKTITLAADQHAYLHYVVNNPVLSQLDLEITVNYTDDSSLVTTPLSVSSIQPYEVYRFPVGVGQLALADINPSKKIRSYSVRLVSAGNPASETRTYEVVSPRKHYKKLLFLNSVGGWDSVLCLGRGKKTLRTQEEVINRDLPVGFSYEDREEQTVSKSGMLGGSFVIANLNGYQREHLIELAISEKVYEQTSTGYLPVRVNFNFDPQDDFENLDEISLEISYPKIRRYTPEL